MHAILASALVTCFTLADAAGGGASDHSNESHVPAASWEECTQMAQDDLMALDRYLEGVHTRMDKIFTDCYTHCPIHNVPDHHEYCTHGHSYHSAYSTWSGNMTYHSTLQWKVGFLIFCILIGALCRYNNPSWMPYTVSLLIVFIILGLIAGRAVQGLDCPSNAYLLANHIVADGYVDQDEWALFTGSVGFHPDSMCGLMTCGDGSQNPSGCRWKFDDLDKKLKLSMMHAERVDAGAGDGKLSADELWTFECNFLRDLLSLADMDPHVLLVIFLPPLLFESACFGIDMGIFKKQLPQILIMAFPGMIVASLITGLLVWAALPDYTFWVCWLIGVIASATDPVAVVALLKDLGAPKTLGTLIEGESLLNDGSAVVLFVWVRNAIGYTHSTVAPDWMEGDGSRYSSAVGIEFLRVVAQMLFYGIFFGGLFGKLTAVMLRRVYNDKYIEGSLVIGMTYFVFWFSELFMGTSAVLAVVIMGLYINHQKSCISPEVLHFLHLFYEMSAHILNTVIFSIAGAKLGLLLVDNSLVLSLMLFPGLGTILAIYPIILLARGLAIAIFYPVLSRMGTGCTWKEAVIMWWGGLRGSVGLALALTLLHTEYDGDMWGEGSFMKEYEWDGNKFAYPTLNCRDQPSTIVLMTLIVVTFTVIINGLTMAPLMRYLKMTEVPADRRFMLNMAHDDLAKKTHNYLLSLQSKPEFTGVQWGAVQQQVVQPEHYDVKDEEKSAWLAFLNMERANFLVQFETGVLGAGAFHRLETFIADLCAQAENTDTADLSQLYEDEFQKLCAGLSEEAEEQEEQTQQTNRRAIRQSRMTFGVKKSSARAYAVAIGYLSAQEEVKHLTHGRCHFATIASEHKKCLERMQLELDAFIASNPSHEATQQQRAVLLTLLKQRGIVEHMLHEGELKDLDAGPLICAINQKIQMQYLQTRHCFKQRADTVHPEPTFVVAGSQEIAKSD